MAVPLRSSSFTATFIAESGTLLSTAFDRYVTAICDPLPCDTELSHVVAARIGLAVGLRRFCGILPDVFPVKRLSFCHSSVLPHTYCEHMADAKFACADVRVDGWYGVCVLLSTLGLCPADLSLPQPPSLGRLPSSLQRSPAKGSGYMWIPPWCHFHVLLA